MKNFFVLILAMFMFAGVVDVFAVEKVKIPKKVVVDPDKSFRALAANFDVGSSVLTEESKMMIANLIREMKKYKVLKIVILGHADITGQEKNNKKLSLMRAKAVFDELYANGIPLEKMDYFGSFGTSLPSATNETSEGRSINRRAEVEVFLK